MKEFRLLVNKSIRIADEQGIRSRFRLSDAAYSELAADHDILKLYILSAFGVALSALNAHRRRLKQGTKITRPYSKRLMARLAKSGYRLDRRTGHLRIPVKAHDYLEFQLPLSAWHRRFLDNPEWDLGSLTLVPGKVILTLRREARATYEPMSAIAVDTNEDSLDGVGAGPSVAQLATVSLDNVRRIQATHYRRRRRLLMKKAHDRRLARRLGRREGERERNRVHQRLHRVSKTLVEVASQSKAAIIIEDLKHMKVRGQSRSLRRRLSSWPRRELHRQIEYKAALAGVPVIKVNPAWTSKTCPVCGARRRDRVGQDFVCSVCDWEMDRQHNAACNILKTALASNEALARAVRFRPGALRHDVVSPLYDLPALLASAREEPSGAELLGMRRPGMFLEPFVPSDGTSPTIRPKRIGAG
jgi:putative transposase